jgi:gas vesicle protein
MNDLLVGGSSGGVVVAILGILFAYIRDRKIDKAKGAVAERTIEAKVDEIGLAGLERRLAILAKTHDEATTVLRDTIDVLRSDLRGALGRIEELERQGRRYRAALAYIRILRSWIAREFPGHDVPPIPAELESDVEQGLK